MLLKMAFTQLLIHSITCSYGYATAGCRHWHEFMPG